MQTKQHPTKSLLCQIWQGGKRERELSEQNHCCTLYPADYFMSSLIGMSFKYTENQCAPTHTACENLNIFYGKKFE